MKRNRLKTMPEYLKCMLGDDVTNPVSSEQLNHLINCIEDLGIPEIVNYPVIFKSTKRGTPVMMAGFNDVGKVVFVVDGVEKFTCDEEIWNEVNFNELQEHLFGLSDGETFNLLEGTFSGEDIMGLF